MPDPDEPTEPRDWSKLTPHGPIPQVSEDGSYLYHYQTRVATMAIRWGLHNAQDPILIFRCSYMLEENRPETLCKGVAEFMVIHQAARHPAVVGHHFPLCRNHVDSMMVSLFQRFDLIPMLIQNGMLNPRAPKPEGDWVKVDDMPSSYARNREQKDWN